MIKYRHSSVWVLMAWALAAGSAAAQPVAVTFSNGAQGWTGPSGVGGATTIEPTGGNPGANMRTVFNDFGITFSNDTNAEFIGDFSRFSNVTVAVDLSVADVSFFGQPVSRDWVLELRDYDNPPAGYPWVSVWVVMGQISRNTAWRTLSVAIADTQSAALPPGWGGYGAENPNTFEPELPPGRTFADVLRGVDEMAFTTLTPGYFFGFTDFDVRIDNVTIDGQAGAPCIADFDGNGDVTSQDLFSFLAAWFAGDPRANVDGNPGNTSQDIFTFLALWFADCP